ncbi:NADPH:quinone reductase-like Zn-dependent oxidoreductase [Rubricella aquisinus]|uniref:NADPH:quinone reductase-like Zn-dependent oxidoreductase n=1 Tax=Rubricella aquisinus TaxID=2028108 RepID=A0A840WNX6_9RHOB|nr:zinc-binding dehydrogenase [Rubricella aquisinus]MBB5516759.1 NADPH:quinone reductase-like Zn-dependent oxidoreductase [Rubricella aquisinus]
MTDLPETMKALILTENGYSGTAEGPAIDRLEPYLEAAEIAVPQVKDGFALIRMIMSPVNPSDLHFIKGEYGEPRVKGAPAGFEGVGTVVAGDTPLVGQRVSIAGAGLGVWAEYALAPIATLIPCRPDLKDTDAAAQIVNPLTALALYDEHRAGDALIVTAALSQVGRMILQLARENDLPAIAVIRREEQAEAARAAGASECIVTAGEWRKNAARLISTVKPRLLIDAVGDQAVADIFGMMPNRARWLTYGKLSSETPRLETLGHLIFMDKRIDGFWLTRWFRDTPPDAIANAIGTVQERFVTGKWQTETGAIVPLDQVMAKLPDALRQPGKCFIRL